MFGVILIPVLFFIIFLVINFLVASKFEDIVFKKGYDTSVHSFAMCFWLGIVGYLYVIALPDLNAQRTVNNSGVTNPNTITNYDSQINTTNEKSQQEPLSQKERYDALVKKAEKYKDTFYGRECRIGVYESLVKNMEILANEDYEDSKVKLQEYKFHLDLLKSKKIK